MTSRSRKSRRITARNVPATAVKPLTAYVHADSEPRRIDRAFRWWLLGTAVGGALLLYFAGAAAGDEPHRGYRRPTASSLKWRTAGGWSGSGAVQATNVSASYDADDSAGEQPPVPRRDDYVVHTQAVRPIDDPFGDKGSAPVAAPVDRGAAPLPASPKLAPLSPMPTPALPDTSAIAALNGNFAQEECPKLSDLKPIGALTNQVTASPGELPKECYFDESTLTPGNRPWPVTTFTWKASGMCHKPLYFEQAALERYGHSTGPFSQPLVNGAHFFGSALLLPYQMGISPPWECEYALGYYRPNSCAPYIIPPFPISPRGAAYQAGTAAALIFALP